MKHAVVIFSGGQDSTTCLGWALNEFDKVTAIGFRYGQRHSVEIEQAMKIADDLLVDFHIFHMDIISELGNSALLNPKMDVDAEHQLNSDLPASFVPNRNAFFINAAHSFAQGIGAQHLVTGVCEEDYSGYPDCRQVFITAIQDALNIGYATDIRIHTPLMNLTKGQTFELADMMGVLSTVIEDTHTCYNGVRDKEFPWGKGCGTCHACELRAKGWEDYMGLVK